VSKVFVSVTTSVDGFIAPAGMRLDNPDDSWMAQWGELQKYVLQQRFFRANLKMGEGGETGEDNRILEETFNRTGTSIMGKRMFEGGERYWPEEAPFHTPVFVLTHEVRDPWERPGGTTFHFVNDGIESALARARDAAGGRDVRIAGGASAIVQYLNAGLVDELHLAVSPMLMGAGTRLLEGVDASRLTLEMVKTTAASPLVTHLTYAVRGRSSSCHLPVASSQTISAEMYCHCCTRAPSSCKRL
jgi:dihydrofolate reductase